MPMSLFKEFEKTVRQGEPLAMHTWFQLGGPAEYFAELARTLADRRGSGVLVLCGPGERELARRIAGLADRPGVASLADESLSIGLTKACVRRADLLITTDSGPRHFAAAFDRPVVTLFGPTHIAWTETYHAGAVHLQERVDCGPCQRRECPWDHRCMKLLHPTKVMAAVEGLLQPMTPPVSSQAPGAGCPIGSRSGWDG